VPRTETSNSVREYLDIESFALLRYLFGKPIGVGAPRFQSHIEIGVSLILFRTGSYPNHNSSSELAFIP